MARVNSWPSPGLSLLIACFFWAAGTVILAWLFLRERISRSMIGIAALAAFGVYLASGVGANEGRFGSAGATSAVAEPSHTLAQTASVNSAWRAFPPQG